MATQNVNRDLLQILVPANMHFATDIYHELCKSDTKNLFFSPISISMALAMAYVGAVENTAQEMKQTLQLTGMTDNEINDAYKSINQVLQSGSKTAYILKIANRIFAGQSYKFLDEFLEKTRRFYGAEAQTMDFANDADGSRKIINKWVEDQTANKIKDLLAEQSINGDTAMVLVNAIYFKGDWAENFDSRSTRLEEFKLASGIKVNVPMMHMQEKFRYGQNKNLHCKIVELPYKGKEVSMFIVLPNKKGTLGKLEKKLSTETLQKLTSEMSQIEVVLSLPKFKLEHMFSVKEILQTLGMKDIFISGKANLSGMDGSRKLYASDVVHKAFIEVNEEGSEAAAATGMVLMLACVRSTMDFTANHPFVFFIRENASKAILFMGRVADPS